MVYIKSPSYVYYEKKTFFRTTEVALEAVKKTVSDFDSLKIDATIFAGISKDYTYPSSSCIISGSIGANNSFSYDIESDFIGFSSALKIAQAFILSKHYKNILVVSAESTFIFDDNDTFKDGAASVIVTDEKTNITLDSIYVETDGSKLKNFYVPMGGTQSLYTKEGLLNKEHHIKIKDNSLFTQASCDAALYVNSKLNENDLKPDILIPSFCGVECFDSFLDNLSFDKSKVYSKTKDYKSSLGVSSAINFCMALEDGFIKKGNTVAIASYGSLYNKSLALLSVN